MSWPQLDLEDTVLAPIERDIAKHGLFDPRQETVTEVARERLDRMTNSEFLAELSSSIETYLGSRFQRLAEPGDDI